LFTPDYFKFGNFHDLCQSQRLTEADLRFYAAELVVAIEKMHKVSFRTHC